MTVVLAWTDDGEGWILADSAASHQGHPRHKLTSFGEFQVLDHGTVEEAAIKISRIHGQLLAAVCGDAHAAQRLLAILCGSQISNDIDLIARLSQLTQISQEWDPFAIFFMLPSSSGHSFVVFDSARGPNVPTKGGELVWIAGSLDTHLYWQVYAGISAVRTFPGSSEVKQALAAVYMQSLGVTNILPTQGIGGAFWSVRLSKDECHWQKDIIYIVYPPNAFHRLPVESSIPGMNTMTYSDVIRCLIRNEVGFTISSVRRALSALPPLGCTQTSLDTAQRQIEQPRRYLAPSRFVAFLSRIGRRVVLYDRGAIHHDGAFTFLYESDILGIDTTDSTPPSRAGMVVSDPLRGLLEARAASGDACFITVVRDEGSSTSALDLHIPIAGDTFQVPV